MKKPAASNSRVGIVGPASPPAGGMAAQTEQLCRLLRGEGVDVEFLQTNKSYRPQWIVAIVGIRAFFRLFQYCVEAASFVRRVDVIHLMSNSGWSWQLFSAPVIWLAYMANTPVIVNYRGGEAKDYLSRSARWVRPTLRKANTLVVPSRFLQQVFSEFGFKSTVVPNIIDNSRFFPLQKNKEKDLTVHIVVVRNLEKIYDIGLAIRAYAVVRRECADSRLTIAGSGPMEEELKRLVDELKLGHCITFTGRLNRDQVENLYRSADIMVNSSTIDNMPNSLLEAMASGVAIVSTDAGGIPWMVEHNKTALLSQVGNVEALASALKRVIVDPELRERLSTAGLEEATNYSWDRVKNQWIHLYRDLSRARLSNVATQ